MNLLGYLITLSNIRGYQASGGPIKNMSINIGDIQTLTTELTAQTVFPLENFKETGYFRIGYIGRYLSKNLREYIYEGVGDPKDEALILTVNYNDRKLETTNDYRSLSFLLHSGKFEDEDAEAVLSYLDSKNNESSIDVS